MSDSKMEKLEARKKEIQDRNKELDEQFAKVNTWVVNARTEYTANLGRIDEIDKLLNVKDEDDVKDKKSK